MKEEIKNNIDKPQELEKLYRKNKQEFRKSFSEISDLVKSDLITFWKIRLTSETAIKTDKFSKLDLLIVIILSLFTGLLAKLPAFFSHINPEFFYTRNLPIIVFNGIILYAFWQKRILNTSRILFYGLTIITLSVFTNLLPNTESDSVVLSLMHVPLLLWCLFGLSFISFDHNNINKRIEFIRFNGELLIMTGLILIAGALLTAITIGLFSVINIDIENFYFEYIALFGSVAAPIVSLYIIQTHPNITNKITPVIATVFTPLVLITLAIYLVSLILLERKIVDDRDLLILLNVMLLAVVAIIVFSVTELDKSKDRNMNTFILFILSALAIIINSIALFAIISRITNGFTPNRTVVLVSNILIFINLILISKELFLAYFNRYRLGKVEEIVAKYLTVYAIWTIIVVFILPFIFALK